MKPIEKINNWHTTLLKVYDTIVDTTYSTDEEEDDLLELLRFLRETEEILYSHGRVIITND